MSMSNNPHVPGMQTADHFTFITFRTSDHRLMVRASVQQNPTLKMPNLVHNCLKTTKIQGLSRKVSTWRILGVIFKIQITIIVQQYVNISNILLVLKLCLNWTIIILNPHILFFLSLNTSFTTLSKSNVLKEDDKEVLFDDDLDATFPEVKNIPVPKVLFLSSFQESYAEHQTFPFELPFSEPYLESSLSLAFLYPELL